MLLKSLNTRSNKLRQTRFSIRLSGIITAVFCLLLFVTAAGCRRESDDPAPLPPPVPADQDPQTEPLPEPETADGLQPEPSPLGTDEIFRDVIDAYQHDYLKYYSDRGYVKVVYEAHGKSIENRFPVSVTFQKPNFVRMEVADGILVCDGDHLWGKILDPFYSNQVLKADAPDLFSSIKEFYPDVKLASAMKLPAVPSNIFWAPPQLILLFAERPLKTLLGSAETNMTTVTGPSQRLLEPRYLCFPEDGPEAEMMACDRILVKAHDGERVFWIDRKTKGVVRIDLPIEQISVPQGVDRILELSMNFPEQVISNEPPETVPGFFSLCNSNTEETEPPGEKVEHFIPPELGYYGEKAPHVRVKPLTSGNAELFLDDDPEGRIRIYAFWGGVKDPDLWEKSHALLQEIAKISPVFIDESNVEFYAVNLDPPSASNSDILSVYGETGYHFPLYRIGVPDLAVASIARLSIPSIIITDGKGIVQKIHSYTVSSASLRDQIFLLLDGKDIYKSDLNLFAGSEKRFSSYLTAFEANDYYAVKSDLGVERLKIEPASDPQRLKLTKVWERSLREPSNPVVIADPPKENDENDERGPFYGAVNIPCESILVPYGGRMLALISTDSEILQSKVIESGEPISMIRSIRTSDEKRYFAVSSFLDTHEVHIFGDDLRLIQTIDVEEPCRQWVADILLNDADGDDAPELIMALIGDSTENLIPQHGIYALTLREDENGDTVTDTWSDEFVGSPFRLGFARAKVPGGESRRVLMALNASDNAGKMIIDDPINGERLATFPTAEDISVLWFAVPDDALMPDKPTKGVAALIIRSGAEFPSFALFASGGGILAETPIEIGSWGDHLERIVAGDYDNDGESEWIVPTREGVIYFFDGNGKLYDQFAVGRKVTGAAVAHWSSGNFLIVTHTAGVIAYKIESEGRIEE